MKTPVLLAAAGLAATCAATSVPAVAQDMGAGAPWSGFYLGGNAGWSGDTSNLRFRDLSSDGDITFHRNGSGSNFLAGIDGGYNWWMGNMLAGVEGDVDWASHTSYLTSARGRLGFGNPRWIFYGTAGVAFIGDREKFSAFSADADEGTSFHRNSNDTGFVGGIGTEFALSHNLGLGVEGLWYDFGSDRHNLAVTAGEPFAVRDNKNFGAVRARLNWYFNQ